MFTAQDYESKVINPKTGRPYSKPKKEWGWDVYYVWRILRFDLGIDPKLPVMAETMVDDGEREMLRQVIQDIEDRLYPLEQYNGVLRWAPLLGIPVEG